MPTAKFICFCLFIAAALMFSCNEEEKICQLTATIEVITIDDVTKELTVKPSGGTEPYDIFWTSHSVLSGADSIVATKVGFPYGPGLYTARVIDKALCEADASVNIEFDGPSCPFYLGIDTTRQGTNMRFLAIARYGFRPFQYAWSTGSTDSIMVVPDPRGTYSVTVTSATGCTVVQSLTFLAGKEGNPRFNLQFTNHENIDLDLYVRTPTGQIIFFGDHFGDGGEFDLDCKCQECLTGPIENIFWLPGTAPQGTYTYWVEMYETCSGGNEESTYTLRRFNLNNVEETFTGTLNLLITKSPEYTFNYQ
jgi:hypothetical protein